MELHKHDAILRPLRFAAVVFIFVGCSRDDRGSGAKSGDHAKELPKTVANKKSEKTPSPDPPETEAPDIAAIHDEIGRLLNASERKEAGKLVRKYVRELPLEEADDLVSRLPLGKLHTEAIDQLAKRFAAEGPDVALAWLDRLPKEGSSGRAYSRLGRELGGSSRERALEHLAGIDNALLRQKFGSQLLRKVAAEDPAKGLEVVATHASLFLTPELAMQDFVGGLNEGGHFLKAADILLEAPQGTMALLTRDIGRAWAESTDKNALDWFERHSQDPGARNIAKSYMNTWAEIDSPAASEWLSSLDASPLRDTAVEAFATRIYREQPVAALEWLATLEEEVRRTEVASQLLRQVIAENALAREHAERLGLLPKVED